ncbi:unnamed protein product [Acanthoscelides obtectus]|uniref:Uncharacterized protein n=1 Tax=Acanthoscelides obtectus TaxID=200917 RepID=A0A9P0PX82_ACAOB|nr:unnamed protein product [Acanthoscelides obtectus]CAK1644065.1 hypothetical protein AOBTE_LOCUS13806 [Acanthoscelides obtectus]
MFFKNLLLIMTNAFGIN